jgi:Fibronectin type III domain
VWMALDAGKRRIQSASSGDGGSTWSSPVTVSGATKDLTAPQLVGADSGTGVSAAWGEFDGSRHSVRSASGAVSGAEPVAVPGAPTGVTAVAGDAQARVEWIAPDSTGGSPISGYRVERRVGEAGSWETLVQATDTTATTYTATGLTNGIGYEFRVAAINSAGVGAPSLPSSPVTPQPPVAGFPGPGEIWKYNESGANLGTAWRDPGYVDTSWEAGRTEMGYGDNDEATTLGWGTNPSAKPVTNYMRLTFDAGSSIDAIQGLELRTIVDDAAVVYLNGQEVWRYNLPAGTITYTTRASRYVAGSAESIWNTTTVPTTHLNAGINTIAVEIHQDAPTSSDLSFNLELKPIR